MLQRETMDFVERTVKRRNAKYADLTDVKLAIEQEKSDYISEIKNLRQYVIWAENEDGEAITEEHCNTLRVLYQSRKALKKKIAKK